MTYFKFLLYDKGLICACWYLIIPVVFVEKTILSLLNCFGSFAIYQLIINVEFYFWILKFVPCSVSFLMPILGLEKAEEPEIILPTSIGSTSIGSLKKQESSRKPSTSALLTMPKPLTVDHNKLWKILKEIGIPDHLTCLLRNLYAGQETTVRTGHGTIDWFQIGKGVQ